MEENEYSGGRSLTVNQNGNRESIIQVSDVVKKFTVGDREVTILKRIPRYRKRNRLKANA